jgi:hypothetical protein
VQAGFRLAHVAVSPEETNAMRTSWMFAGLFVALVLANTSPAQEAKFELGAMGGSAVSADNSTLVVSLTAKTELVFFDTVAGKEAKRVKVEFQPTELVWGDKVIFAAQKGSGVVHILDADTGKEVATGKAGGPVRNLVIVKDACFASTDSREVYAIDAKGKSTKLEAQGSFIAADPAGAFVCTVVDGRARTDIMKYTVDGTKLSQTGVIQGKVGASLTNVQGVRVSGDGKQVGVIAGGGWTDVDRKRHYGVPLYDLEDMKTMNGELETGAFPSACAFHTALPLVFACNGKQGSVFSAKSMAPGQKLEAPRDAGPGVGGAIVCAFVAKGKKLAWGTSDAGKNVGTLKFYDLELTKEQQDELAKKFK